MTTTGSAQPSGTTGSGIGPGATQTQTGGVAIGIHGVMPSAVEVGISLNGAAPERIRIAATLSTVDSTGKKTGSAVHPGIELSPTTGDAGNFAATLPTGRHYALITTSADAPESDHLDIAITSGAWRRNQNRITSLSAAAWIDHRSLSMEFVVEGDAPRRVLILGIGLALSAAPAGQILDDPELVLEGADGGIVAANDNWASAGTSAEVAAALADAKSLASALRPKDAALLLDLSPGSYTIRLAAADEQAGTALLEIIEVP